MIRLIDRELIRQLELARRRNNGYAVSRIDVGKCVARRALFVDLYTTAIQNRVAQRIKLWTWQSPQWVNYGFVIDYAATVRLPVLLAGRCRW